MFQHYLLGAKVCSHNSSGSTICCSYSMEVRY